MLENWKKYLELETDSDNNCNLHAQFSQQRIGTWTREVGNTKTTWDHQNYSIADINQNTKKSPGDLSRLAVTQTTVKKTSDNYGVKNFQNCKIRIMTIIIEYRKEKRACVSTENCFHCNIKKLGKCPRLSNGRIITPAKITPANITLAELSGGRAEYLESLYRKAKNWMVTSARIFLEIENGLGTFLYLKS